MKMKKIITLILTAAIATLALVSCHKDGTHKHSTDEYGFCYLCLEDVSRPFFNSGSILSTGEVFTKDGDITYFRLKPNGTGNTVITVKCGSAVMDGGISLYTKTQKDIPFTVLDSEDEKIKKIRTVGVLDQNEFYYISFAIKKGGTVILDADCHISNM